MVDIDMMDYLDSVERTKSLAETLALLYSELRKLGIKRFYYICVPPNALFDAEHITFFQHGYNEIPGFVPDFAAYLKSEEANIYLSCHQNGGTRARFAASLKPNGSLKNLSALLLKYKNHLNMGAALTVPVYGPNAHYGFFYMPVNTENDTNHRHRMFEFLCNAAHHRNVELKLESCEPIKLSPREKNVLTELVKGKNNSLIAADLGISRHTVDEYIRRIYIKLDVHDRVSASVKAMRLFLLQDDAEIIDSNDESHAA